MKRLPKTLSKELNRKPRATKLTGVATGKGFPIVGIGASAGGFEAFDLFFKNIPPDSGMACVVMQHLDPTREGMLPELLQRTTPMKVIQAKDGLKVNPNGV
ncbi:MAG: hypothetical protein HOP37_02960, partial [Cyclobacteriaceae bacterium]|nr:hypothetical protein [Cyclobacteriaceae bacterium]